MFYIKWLLKHTNICQGTVVLGVNTCFVSNNSEVARVCIPGLPLIFRRAHPSALAKRIYSGRRKHIGQKPAISMWTMKTQEWWGEEEELAGERGMVTRNALVRLRKSIKWWTPIKEWHAEKIRMCCYWSLVVHKPIHMKKLYLNNKK